MICNLEQNKDLAKALVTYVNALTKEALEKDPVFDYTKIIKTVYDKAYEKNKDTEQALGAAYHVPQIIFDVIKRNPKLELTDFIKKGFDIAGASDLIEKLKTDKDPLTILSQHLGLSQRPLEEVEKALANEPKAGGEVVSKVDETGLVVIDKLLTSKSLLNTIGTQTEDANGVKHTDKTNDVKNFYYNVLQGVLMNMPSNALDMRDVTYGGHKGFMLKPVREQDLPAGNVYPGRTPSKYVQLALVDTKGNYLYFTKDGRAGTAENGRIVYFAKQSYSKDNVSKKINSVLEGLKNVDAKDHDLARRLVVEEFERQIADLKSLESDMDAGKKVLLDITGGAQGIPESKGTFQTLSKFKLSTKEKESIGFSKEKDPSNPKEYVELPAIKFDTYKEPVTIKSTKKLGSDVGLLENIISVLMDDLSLLGKPLSAMQRKNYADQFLNVNNINYLNLIAEGDKLSVLYNGKEITSKDELKKVIGDTGFQKSNTQEEKSRYGTWVPRGVFVTFKKDPYLNGNKYEYYNINNGVITTEDKPYTDFIFEKSEPKVPFDATTARPMIVNGYFSYQRADIADIVQEKVQETLKTVPEDIKSNRDYEGLLDDIQRSKLIESRSNAEQRKKADEWVNKSALFKAKDSSGKPLFTVTHLRNLVNSDAWATFNVSAMTLYKGADSTHKYHEAWHAFSQLYLTRAERTKLYDQVKNQDRSFTVVKKTPGSAGTNAKVTQVKFKDATRHEIEEHIAEEFRIFAMNDGKFKTIDKKSGIFKRIWEALKSLFKGSLPVNVYSNAGSVSALDEVFEFLYNATDDNQLNSLEPSIHNAEFGTLNSGIIDETGEQVLSPADMLLLTQSMDGIISEATTKYVLRGSYGMPISILTGSKNRNTVYNVLIKTVLDKRLNEMLDERKTNYDSWSEQQRERSDNSIRILSTALKPEFYGDLTKLASSNVISHHLQNSAYKEMFSEDAFNSEEDSLEIDMSNPQEYLEKFDRSANSIESEKLADTAVKYLVKSLLKQHKTSDNYGEPVLNDLGFPETVDFLATWRILMSKISGEKTLPGLYNNLVEARDKKIDPLFGQLLNKLGDPSVVMTQSEPGANLWLKVLQGLNLTTTHLVSVNFGEENLPTEQGEAPKKKQTVSAGKSSADYFKVKNRDWPTKFAQDASVFITKNKDKVNIVNLKEVYKQFIDSYDSKTGVKYQVNSYEQYIPFLRSIGLYLEDNEVIRDTLTSEDVNYIADAIGKAANSDVLPEIANIVDFLSSPHNITIEGRKVKIEPLDTRVNNIAALQAEHSLENASQMRPTPEGTTKSIYALNSTITQMLSPLNKVSSKAELFSSGDYKHMNHLSEKINPNIAGSVMFNSMFKTTDGSRNRVTIGSDKLNEIHIFDLVGAQYADTKGVSHSGMTASDKFITDFTSLLLQGYIEGMTPGEKSSHFAIKVDKLYTYNGKKTNHLYIDTTAFMKTKDDVYMEAVDPFQEFLKIVYPKLQGELRRIKMIKDHPEIYDNIEGFSNGTKLSTFDDILHSNKVYAGQSLKDYLVSDKFLAEIESSSLVNILQTNALLRNRLDSQILEYFSNVKQRYETEMFDKVFTRGMPEFLSEALTMRMDQTDKDKIASIKDAAMWSYTLNAWIHKTEVNALINTDSFQFNHAKDEMTKRFPTYQSSGNLMATDSLSQNYINTLVGRKYEESLGIEKAKRLYDGTMNSAIIRESEVDSEYIPMLIDLFTKGLKKRGYNSTQIQRELFGEDKDGVGSKTNVKGGLIGPYKKIKEGDGQGWISFDSYRILKKLEGNWSDYQEALYKKIIAGENVPAEDILHLFPVYKLQYAGPLATKDIYPVNSIHKFSLLPLIPSVIKDTPMDKIHREMITQDVDYALFASGSKQSFIKASPDSKGDLIYDGDTSNIKPDFKFTKNPIYVAYLKNQTAVNREFKGEATFSTQLRLLVNSGLYEHGVPIDYNGVKEDWDKLSQKHKESLSPLHTKSVRFLDKLNRLIDYKRKELLKEMGWNEHVKDNPEGTDEDRLTFVTKHLKKKGISDSELEFMGNNTAVKVDMSLSPVAARLERLLVSMVNNRIARPKIKGEAFVQVSGAFTQKYSKPSTTDLEKYGTSGLASYIVDADGKKDTKGFKCKIALTENFQHLDQLHYFEKGVSTGKPIAIYTQTLDTKSGKKKRIKDVDATFIRLNEMIKDEAWLNHEDNRKKIRMTGVRIPVQGPNSTEFTEIWEFLPAAAGPIIIIPAEIVAKSGGDFDVDKMTIYLNHITRRGTLLRDNYATEEDLQKEVERLEEVKKKLDAKKIEIKDLKDQKDAKWLLFKDYLNSFRKQIVTDSNHNYISAEQLQSLTTRDNKALINTLSNPDIHNFIELISPEAFKIYNSNIKGLKEDSIDNIEQALETLFSEKNELSNVVKDLGDALEHLNNFTAGIENELVDSIVDILQSPEMAFALMSPNDTHIAKPLAEEMKPELQRVDNEVDFNKSVNTGKTIDYDKKGKGISPSSIMLEDYNLKKQQDNIVGKQSLGITALDNKANNQLNIAGATMALSVPIEVAYKVEEAGGVQVMHSRTENVPVTLSLKHNIIKYEGREVISLSDLYDKNKEHSIADVISQLMNGFVDVGKDAWVAYIQGNPEVVPKILWMLEAGVPIRDIVYFVNNPMIRKYVKEKNQRKSALHKVMYGMEHNSEFATSESRKEVMGRKFAVDPSFYLQHKLNGVNNSTSLWGYYTGLKKIEGKDSFSTGTLERVAKSKMNINSPDQQAGFLQYLYIERLVEEYNDFKKAVNVDTKTTNDLFTAEIKMMEVENAKNFSSLGKQIMKYYIEKGPVSPFFIQKFMRNLVGPLFSFRDNPKVNEYIRSQIGDFKIVRAIKKQTGFDPETYSNRYRNALAQNVFSDQLRQYKSGDTEYKGIPITKESIQQFTKEFRDQLYLAGDEPDSYQSRNLAPVNINVFKDATLEEFIEFSMERVFLRRSMPLNDDLIKGVEFSTRKKRLLNLDSIDVQKLETESSSEYEARLNKFVYENMLMNNALTNTYNIWQLFRSGENTVATELMDIITNYPVLAEKYSVLKQFNPKVLDKSPGVLNFQIKNWRELDEGLIDDYTKQLRILGDPGKIKLTGEKNKYLNKYISDFFNKLPIYAFLQTGMDSSEFSLASVMPVDNYMKIMEQGAKSFTDRLNKGDTHAILGGFDRLFREQNNIRNRKFRGRGLDYKKTTKQLSGSEGNTIYDKSFIHELSSGVYTIDDTYMRDGKTYEVSQDTIKALRKNNPDVKFVLSLEDLELDSKDISREKIDQAINKLKTLDGDIVFSTDSLSDDLSSDLSVYLSQSLKDSFNYTDPDSPDVPSMKDLISRAPIITKQDIDQKKNEC